MMKRDARSEGKQILRRSRRRIGRRRKLGAAGVATAAPLGPMPAVGARRSTRVFVPSLKRAGSVGPTSPSYSSSPTAGRVLRSGKRLSLTAPLKKRDKGGGGGEEDDDTWLRLMGRNGGSGGAAGLRWGSKDARKNGCHPHPMSPVATAARKEGGSKNRAESESPMSIELSSEPRSFGIVYSRKKRPRPTSEEDSSTGSSIGENDMKGDVKDDEKRFGIVFSRKQRRKRRKVANWVSRLAIPNVSMEEAAKAGFSRCDILTTLDAREMVLGVLVEPNGSLCFSRFVTSLLRWVRTSPEVKRVQDLTVLLFSGSIANVFSLHGIHFLPIEHRKYNAVQRKSSASCGFCAFYGADRCVPLLFLDFCALPSFFWSLHVVLLLPSLRIPASYRRWILGIRQSTPVADEVDKEDLDDDLDEGYFLSKSAVITKKVDLGRTGVSGAVGSYISLEQAAGVVVRGSRLKKHQKKRSSSRQPQQRHRSSLRFLSGLDDPKQSLLEDKPSLPSLESTAEPVHMKSLRISLDLLENADDSDMSTPIGSNGKRRSALKSPAERTVSEKLALAEVRQNIDSVRCKANILVIQTDRCWRENGVEVMLELSDSNEWCLVVKMQGKTRISHKPRELRPCVVNRFTHAYMWAAGEGWKLEFLDKWDWVLFKELHSECRERNSQGKMIPIPGVHKVPDDVEHDGRGSFKRPDEIYIRGLVDEVTRALSMDSIYDMDSEDEEWLNELNPINSDVKSHQILPEDFEMIISTFEKDAFNNPEENGDLDRLFPRCQDLGKVEMISAVYDYWINKRNKKGAPLVTIFQFWASVRKPQFSPKASYKKKRSFKRQRSQVARFKPEAYLQDNAEEEVDVRRVQEAETAAKQAIETAIHLRTRAQTLMANAELATYKSVTALRIAEAASLPNSSPDLIASILN